MTNRNRLLLVASQLCLLPIMSNLAMAQDVIEHRRVQTTQTVATPSAASSSSSLEVTHSSGLGQPSPNVFHEKFQKRLTNLLEQLHNGISKGWLTAEEAASLKKVHSGLVELEISVHKAGFPKAEADELEKKVTSFTASLSTAMSKPKTATAPQPAAPKAVTTKATTTTKKSKK